MVGCGVGDGGAVRRGVGAQTKFGSGLFLLGICNKTEIASTYDHILWIIGLTTPSMDI